MSGGTHCVILNEGREFTVGPGGNTVSYSSLRDFANRWSRFAPFNRVMNDARRSTGTVKHRVERLRSM